MKTFEEFKYNKNEENYINDLNIAANRQKETNSFQLWDLAKKYPDKISEEDLENFHDRILVPLSNNNAIKKNIKNSERLRMLFEMLSSRIDVGYNGDFIDWIENGKITVYRGQPYKPKSDELPPNEYLSFTLSKDYAKKFTQSDWAAGGWVDRNASGYLITATISIKDNFHIYNNAGWEEEVVVKGPIKFDKIEKV